MNDTTQSQAVHLTVDTFDQALADAGDKPVFVDFFATWCGPCKIASPVVDKLAGEYADSAVIAKVDVDENHELSARYGVMSIPTVVVLKKGADGAMEEAERKVGFPGEQGYRDMIDPHVAAE